MPFGTPPPKKMRNITGLKQIKGSFEEKIRSMFSKLFLLCHTKFESLCFPEVEIFRRSKVDDDEGNAKDRELVL